MYTWRTLRIREVILIYSSTANIGFWGFVSSVLENQGFW